MEDAEYKCFTEILFFHKHFWVGKKINRNLVRYNKMCGYTSSMLGKSQSYSTPCSTSSPLWHHIQKTKFVNSVSLTRSKLMSISSMWCNIFNLQPKIKDTEYKDSRGSVLCLGLYLLSQKETDNWWDSANKVYILPPNPQHSYIWKQL